MGYENLQAYNSVKYNARILPEHISKAISQTLTDAGCSSWYLLGSWAKEHNFLNASHKRYHRELLDFISADLCLSE